VSYQGTGKQLNAKRDVTWHIAMRPDKRRLLEPAKPRTDEKGGRVPG